MTDRAASLKSLETRLAKATGERDTMLAEQRDLNRRITDLQRTIASLQGQIDALSATRVVITEHALLRYLERVRGVDLGQVQAEMLPAEVEERIRTLGSGTFPVNGFSLRVKRGQVVTVITPHHNRGGSR